MLEMLDSAGKRTILIVDDQDVVRKVMRTMLGRIGFTIVEAGSGIEALQLVERDHDRITGVLLDWNMPGLSGEATFLALRRLRADLPVVFMSGVEREDAFDALQAHASVGFIHKPCGLQELMGLIEGIFDPATSTPTELDSNPSRPIARENVADANCAQFLHIS